MILTISQHTPNLSETQFHGLITREYKEATTLRGWEAFKNYFIKLLNHIPGISLVDKEQALKTFYESIHPYAQYDDSYHPEQDIANIVATLKKITELMHPNHVEKLTFHLDGVHFLENEDKLTPVLNHGSNTPIYLCIEIYDKKLEPIRIENNNGDLITITDIFSKQFDRIPTIYQNHAFTLKKCTHETQPSNTDTADTDNNFSHLPTLIDDIIHKQNENTLTAQECSSYITYLENLVNDTPNTTSTIDQVQKFIYTLKFKRDAIAEYVDFPGIKKEWQCFMPFLYKDDNTITNDNKLTSNTEKSLSSLVTYSTKEIKKNFENDIDNFKENIKEIIFSFKNELINKKTSNITNLFSLNERIGSLNKKMERLAPHLYGAYLSPEIKSAFDDLLKITHEKQAQLSHAVTDQHIHLTMSKNFNTLENNINTLMRNASLAAVTYNINTSHQLNTPELHSVESIASESLYSLHINQLSGFSTEINENETDSGLSKTPSQASINESVSFTSSFPSSHDQGDDNERNNGVIKTEIDINTAPVIGKNPHKKSRLAAIGSAAASKLLQPFERIANVEARRTALQNPVRSFYPVD